MGGKLIFEGGKFIFVGGGTLIFGGWNAGGEFYKRKNCIMSYTYLLNI